MKVRNVGSLNMFQLQKLVFYSRNLISPILPPDLARDKERRRGTSSALPAFLSFFIALDAPSTMSVSEHSAASVPIKKKKFGFGSVSLPFTHSHIASWFEWLHFRVLFAYHNE